jgi:GrpB-like predicted nucleotidyltransferase (UPF0157 family)
MLIQAYQESWKSDFIELKSVIHEALIPLSVTIEHVGSTAIHKLAAKPIIDIDIVFDKPVIFDEIKIRFEKIGYRHNGNQGIPDREVFKRAQTDIKHDVLDFIMHHLYVCPSDSEELERHILFRDYLILNEEARIQYQKLKYDIAEKSNQDRKKYAALKEVKGRSFINMIIEKAKKDKTKI